MVYTRMNPEISIIILNYKSRGLTRECIKSFRRLKDSVPFEIIVVDNGGEPGLQEMLSERFPEVKYLKLPRNMGFAAGNNMGARVARGKYFLFANQDLTAHEGSLDTLYAFMEAQTDVAISGPRLINPDGSLQQSYYRFYSPLTPLYRRTFLGTLPFGKKHLDTFLMKDRGHADIREVDFLMGACLCVRRSATEVVGLLDERFFFYFEDTDWCRRFWEAGYRVCYVPSATMMHLHSRDSAQKMGLSSLLSKSTRLHIYSGIKYFLKYGGKPLTYVS